MADELIKRECVNARTTYKERPWIHFCCANGHLMDIPFGQNKL